MTGKTKCIHNKRKTLCIQCGGGSICEHNKRRSTCVECNGGSICEHKKQRSICIECNGGSICEHKRQRSICKECDGGGICEHKKVRSKCVECNGGSICEHKKVRSICIECDGASICEHKRQRSICIECNGGSICEHKKVRSYCIECNGGSICEHKKIRTKCVECGGSEICIHKKQKRRCKKCDGSDLCKSEWCEIIASKKYKGYCLRCFMFNFPDEKVARNYKTKEKTVTDYIQQEFIEEKWVCDKTVGNSRKRPDLMVQYPEYSLIIEIDENQHQGYDCTCENKRLSQILEDLEYKPIVFIRFNPDKYNKSDISITSCWHINKLGICVVSKTKEKEWKERLITLKEQVKYWIHNKPDQLIQVIELFYDC